MSFLELNINLFLAVWTTRLMAEDKDRELILETTLREAVIYVIFLITATISN